MFLFKPVGWVFGVFMRLFSRSAHLALWLLLLPVKLVGVVAGMFASLCGRTLRGLEYLRAAAVVALVFGAAAIGVVMGVAELARRGEKQRELERNRHFSHPVA